MQTSPIRGRDDSASDLEKKKTLQSEAFSPLDPKQRIWYDTRLGRKPRVERGGCPQCGDAIYDLIVQNLMSVNLMYAVFSDGGKQYRVEEGQELDIDFRDVKKGSTLKFDKILAVGPGEKFQIGKPDVPSASVTAEVLGSAFGDKLVVQKFRRRKNSRRKTGHRQIYTRVRVAKIVC